MNNLNSQSYSNVSSDMTGEIGLKTTQPAQQQFTTTSVETVGASEPQSSQNVVTETAQNVFNTASNVVGVAANALGDAARNTAEAVGLTEPEKTRTTTTTRTTTQEESF